DGGAGRVLDDRKPHGVSTSQRDDHSGGGPAAGPVFSDQPSNRERAGGDVDHERARRRLARSIARYRSDAEGTFVRQDGGRRCCYLAPRVSPSRTYFAITAPPRFSFPPLRTASRQPRCLSRLCTNSTSPRVEAGWRGKNNATARRRASTVRFPANSRRGAGRVR